MPKERRFDAWAEVPLLAVYRLAVGFLLGLIIVTLTGLLAIFGMNVWARVIDSSDTQWETRINEYLEVRRELNNQEKLIDAVNRASREREVWMPRLIDLMEVLPLAGKVKTIEIRGEDAEIYIAGTAPARAAVVELEERLRVLPWVGEVVSPSSNLLQRINPEYSFTLMLESSGAEQIEETNGND